MGLVATAAHTDVVKLWDLRSRKEVGMLAGHHVTFSPAGKLLAAALKDDPLVLHDSAKQKNLGDLVGHADWAQAMGFSAEGKTLLFGGDDHAAKVRDLDTLLADQGRDVAP